MPTTMTFTLASPDLITQLAGIVGAAQVLTDPVELAPFLTDWRSGDEIPPVDQVDRTKIIDFNFATGLVNQAAQSAGSTNH